MHARRLAALVAVTITTCSAIAPVRAATRALPASPGGPLVQVRNGAFILDGRPLSPLHGVNYEGPPDRPWHMWEDGRFDPALIARDFDLIAAAGYNPVRIFIQRPLSDEVLNGDFSRLDTVVDLAAARGLRLLVTFNDDGNPDLMSVVHADALIAGRLAGNGIIFGYDLRNEPNLPDIGASTYPTGTQLPLLSRRLTAIYHERVGMDAVQEAQGSGDWAHSPFDGLSAKMLY